MEYLTLNNGIRMPLIGFGTFMLGGGTCPEAVLAAIENGCRMIDTAEAYGNEKEVGKGIKQSGVAREELFPVTKVNFKSYENAAQAVPGRSADGLYRPAASALAVCQLLRGVAGSGEPVCGGQDPRHRRFQLRAGSAP